MSARRSPASTRTSPASTRSTTSRSARLPPSISRSCAPASPREKLSLETIRESTWNPLVSNPGSALHLLLSRDFAPVEERLESLAGRLAAVPEHLAVARDVLGDMPQVHVETAIGQFEGTLGLLRGPLDEALASAPGLRAQVEPARAAASGALEAHLGWLRDRLESGVTERDPRLGPEKYAAKLWATLDADLTPDDVLHRAERDLVRIEGEIARAAAEYLGEPAPPPDDAGALVRRALDAVAAEGPVDDTTVLPLCERGPRRDDRVRPPARPRDRSPTTRSRSSRCPRSTGAWRSPTATRPARSRPRALPTFFAVAPTPTGWDDARVASFYREYNASMLHNLTVHEAMPGHVLQLAHSRRLQHPEPGAHRVHAAARSSRAGRCTPRS